MTNPQNISLTNTMLGTQRSGAKASASAITANKTFIDTRRMSASENTNTDTEFNNNAVSARPEFFEQ